MKANVIVSCVLFAALAACTINTEAPKTGTKTAGVTCSDGSECASGTCLVESGEEEGAKSEGTCTAPASTWASDAGAKADASSAAATCRNQRPEPSCDDCKADEYCEPGSSASGIYCLPLCTTDADCKCGTDSFIHCRPNTWVSSYRGNICRTGK